MTLLGGLVISIFTKTEDIHKHLGWFLALSSFAVAITCLVAILHQKIWDWKVVNQGKKVLGKIISIDANEWSNMPVIIHYSYQIDNQKYLGSTWTTTQHLNQVPSVGSDCWVLYDKMYPQKSVIDDLLKPPCY